MSCKGLFLEVQSHAGIPPGLCVISENPKSGPGTQVIFLTSSLHQLDFTTLAGVTQQRERPVPVTFGITVGG